MSGKVESTRAPRAISGALLTHSIEAIHDAAYGAKFERVGELLADLGLKIPPEFQPNGSAGIPLAVVVPGAGLQPVWSDDPAEQDAISAKLIELCKEALDKGVLDFSALDIQPTVALSKLSYPLGQVADALKKRRGAIKTALGFPWGPITTEQAAAIAAKIVELKVSQDDFRSAVESHYLGLIYNGQIAEADQLAEAFAPAGPHGEVNFSPSDIPEVCLMRSYTQGNHRVLEHVTERGKEEAGLRVAQKLVQAGRLTQDRLDERLKTALLNCARYGGELPKAFDAFSHLVDDAELAAIKQSNIDSALHALQAEAYSSRSSPQLSVLSLKHLGVEQGVIDNAAKASALRILAGYGQDSRYAEYAALVPAGFISDAEVAEQLTLYTDALATNASTSDEWLKAAEANRESFRPGALDAAILKAGYFTRFGYWPNAAAYAKVQAAYPGLSWDKLDELAPPCYCGTDLRATLLSQLEGKTERTLARLLCDFLGQSKDAKSIGTFVGFLSSSLALAIGLPGKTHSDTVNAFFEFVDKQMVHEGTDTEKRQQERKDQKKVEERLRAELVRHAFGADLPQSMPYAELLKLRRLVAKLVRQHANEEIDS